MNAMNRNLFAAGLCAFLSLLNLAHAAEPKTNPFFPFCIDWHDAKTRSFEEQSVMLKELGYDGFAIETSFFRFRIVVSSLFDEVARAET